MEAFPAQLLAVAAPLHSGKQTCLLRLQVNAQLISEITLAHPQAVF